LFLDSRKKSKGGAVKSIQERSNIRRDLMQAKGRKWGRVGGPFGKGLNPKSWGRLDSESRDLGCDKHRKERISGEGAAVNWGGSLREREEVLYLRIQSEG